MNLTVTLKPESYARLKATLRQANQLGRAVRIGLVRAGARLERLAKERVTGDILKVRSGSLRRSITSRIIEDKNGVSLAVGSTVGVAAKYAPIHEFGGVIKPVRAKMLAVPVGPALTPSGVARYPSPRDVPVRLGFRPTKTPGTALLVERTKTVKGRRGRTSGRVWFVLKKQVRIPTRQWLSRSILPNKGVVVAEIDAAIEAHLRQA